MSSLGVANSKDKSRAEKNAERTDCQRDYDTVFHNPCFTAMNIGVSLPISSYIRYSNFKGNNGYLESVLADECDGVFNECMHPDNKDQCAMPIFNISLSCGVEGSEQCVKEACTLAVGNFFFAAQGDYTFTRKVSFFGSNIYPS